MSIGQGEKMIDVRAYHEMTQQRNPHALTSPRLKTSEFYAQSDKLEKVEETKMLQSELF